MLRVWSISLVLLFLAIASLFVFPDLSVSESKIPANRNAPFQGAGQKISPYADSPLGAAQKSLEILQTLTIKNLISKNRIRAETYAKDLGFKSEVEVPLASLGSELKVKTAKLQKLKTFQDGDNPRDYLMDARESIFAMSVNGQPQSSVSVAERIGKSPEGVWRWVKRGSGKEIKQIEQLRKATQADFLMKIRGFGKFLVLDSSGELVIIPIYKGRVGSLELEAGERIDANRFFIELSAMVSGAEQTGKENGVGLLR